MKSKVVLICMFCSIMMIGSSFKVAGPSLAPVPLPNYSMVDITGLDDWCYLHNNDQPFYGIKIVFSGYLYSDNTQGHTCEFIVSNPCDTDIWNADALYWVSTITPVDVFVYVKRYSNSSWTQVGACSTSSSSPTPRSYTTSQTNCLQCLTFNYADLQVPAAPIEE